MKTKAHTKLSVKRHEVTQPTDPTIKIIPLSRGYEAIVDLADYDHLSQWNWFVLITGRSKYAMRGDGKGNKRVLMHREILKTTATDVDHKDGNGLNNTRANLRPATRTQNNANMRRPVHNKSGYKGVCWHRGKWVARIGKNRKKIIIGKFDNPNDAALAYQNAAKELYGEYGRA